MPDYPRENLIRMSTDIRADTGEGGMMTLVGVPIVFNDWTEIHSWEGSFKERIDPGALDVTLAERGDKIKVLFNHGMDPSIGEKPLGKPTMQDIRDDGLHVEVPLVDTTYNRDLQALLEAGALDGMSFRFGVVAEEWDNLDDPMPERTITELRLYEYGPVSFAAYEATTVGVRTAAEYAEYRQRQNALHPEDQPKPDPAPAGRSADNDPPQRQPVSHETVAQLIRTIELTLKGVTT